MVLSIYLDKANPGELHWEGDALATVAQYKAALTEARKICPKRPRDAKSATWSTPRGELCAFLPLDKYEYIELEEGIFVVNENLELLNGTPRTSETIRCYLARSLPHGRFHVASFARSLPGR
ncbi:hypothetical protein GS682_04640 [Nostoc sp. B(2019)]|nr:hypothetical protein [Nostoc sp. B(2019)]